MGGVEIAPLRQIGRTTPPHLDPPPFSACIYALGKNGSITSPRRWERLFQSARRAKVDLIRSSPFQLRVSLQNLRKDSLRCAVDGLSKWIPPWAEHFFGNLVQWKDAMGGTLVSRTQAALTPGMRMREALVRGKPPPRLHPVHGFDLRGHALTKKASAFVRIDGADHVTPPR